MIQVSELDARMLAELEEAQEQTITSLLNTVIQPIGAPAEVSAYREASLSLIKRGLVRIAVLYDKNRRLVDEDMERSVELLNLFVSEFIFDRKQNLWVMSGQSTLPRTDSFPHLVLTEAGLSQAIELLQQRGYRWWLSQG
jgi:hypothetical protein